MKQIISPIMEEETALKTGKIDTIFQQFSVGLACPFETRYSYSMFLTLELFTLFD